MQNNSTTPSHIDPLELARKSRVLLKDRAYKDLKGKILDGQLSPGTFMSERQLAAEMKMSKTPIRAALERLEGEGLVRVSPQQGIIVREISVQEMADQFEIRTALETYAVRTIAGRLTQAQTQLLENNLAAQKADIQGLNCSRMVELDMEFHMLLCEFLGNQEIRRVTSQLRERVRRVINMVNEQDPTRMVNSYEEHRGIAEAVFSGHADLAASRLVDHFEFGKRRLLSPRCVDTVRKQSIS